MILRFLLWTAYSTCLCLFMSVIHLAEIFTENTSSFEVRLSLSPTWFLLWFKKMFLQYIFFLSHFSQRHKTIEVAGLIPMHHLFLSAGESVPTAWLCWVTSSVQRHCALHLQGVCQLFGLCHGAWGWPHNFLEEVGNPWSHQKGLPTNDTMQAAQ